MVGGLLDVVLGSAGCLFVVVSPTGVTGGFRLRGYAGSSGRLDVIARCILVSQLCPRCGFIGVLLGPPRPPRVLVVKPGVVFRSERHVVVELARVLERGSTEYMEVLDVGFEWLVNVIGRSGFRHVLLKEDGRSAFKDPGLVSGRAAFYLGSHVDMPDWAEALVRRSGAISVSLGPLSVHTEHAMLAVLLLRGELEG
jgi:tRNA (pseudouridine54-N1)-methyltransferase